MGQPKVGSKTSSRHQIMVELFAAKDLVGSKLKGKPNPYAIITCGNEKRFSSVIRDSRNPLWGEDFNFSVPELPVQINVAIYDWNIFSISVLLGSVAVPVESEGRTATVWHTLESPSGQVSFRIETQVSENAYRINGYGGANPQRRIPPLETHGLTVVHQKPGSLRTISGPHPNEVVDHSYTCALEALFLYHGQMYVSARHICFYSYVFKEMKVVIPFEDIDKIQTSQHAWINPAITIILRLGAGGRGVPPLKSSNDGRATYMFASFLNRNHVLKNLQRAQKNFNEMLEVEKENAVSELCAHSISVRGSKILDKVPEESSPKTEKLRLIQGEALVSINDEVFPDVAELFANLLNDDSNFTGKNYSARKDANFVVFENVQQPHDVPSGSYSEVTYNGALLEVCMKKLVSYPEVARFIEDKKDQFPSVKVCDVFKCPPKLIMLDEAGQQVKTIRIDDWKREHILQFLREKVKPLAAD